MEAAKKVYSDSRAVESSLFAWKKTPSSTYSYIETQSMVLQCANQSAEEVELLLYETCES